MKNALALLTLIIIPFTVSTQSVDSCNTNNLNHKSKDDSLLEYWQEAFRYRTCAISKNYGIRFYSSDFPLNIKFQIPDHISASEEITYIAEYNQEGNFFFINPRLKYIPFNLDSLISDTATTGWQDFWLPNVREMIDHELGHYIANKISKQCGYGNWPVLSSCGIDTIVARHIVSEGIAEVFGKGKYNIPSPSLQIYLPNNRKSNTWFFRDWHYPGGYWFVFPIVDTFGAEGIQYLIEHPFSYKRSKIRKAAIKYQSRALEKLSKRK